MKKTYHFPRAVTLIIAVIFVSLVFISTIEEPIVQESDEVKKLREEIPTIFEEPVQEEVIEEKFEEKEEVIVEEEPEEEKPIVKTFISDAKCEDGIISLSLNNLYDDTLNVKWSTFFVSGKINPVPGCDREYLEPGESTFCSNVGRYPRTGKRRVAIAMYKHTTVGVTVDCDSKIFLTGSAVGDLPYYGFNPVFFVFMLTLFLFTFNYYRVHY